jgi:hypothetical protein
METHNHTGAEQDGANRRVARRMRTLKKATIILRGGYSVYDCIVRNISDTGALLQVTPLGIPAHFELVLDAAIPRRMCTVRWRTESAMGVSFDDMDARAPSLVA